MASRVCIFCGGPGLLTRDHVLTKRASRRVRSFRGALTFRTIPHNQDGTVSEWETPHFEVAPKVVCETVCNNGWLRILEERAWPIIEPLMIGARRTISLRRQAILAAQVTAKVMVGEFAGNNELGPYFTPEERYIFHRSQTPPGKVFVWLAGTTRPMVGHSEGLQILFDHPDGHTVRGYLAFLMWDRLVMVLFAHRYVEQTKWQFPISGLVIPIWPPTAKQEWPPLAPLDEDRIETWRQRMKELEPEILGPGRNV